jgi:Brp/Blh family beta-carotene 15,15'-monooxygenase
MIKLNSVQISLVVLTLAIATSVGFFFAPALAWWVSGSLAVVGLVAVGIPHGALDVLTHTARQAEANSISFMALYICAIGFVLLGWWLIPTTTLVFFLGLSAWHFGQADFELWGINRGGLVWGIFVLMMILGWHLDEVSSILSAIHISDSILSRAQNASTWIENSTLIGWGISMCIACYNQKVLWILSLLILACSPFLPVIIAFMFFFVGQHSLAGWSHLKNGLRLSSRVLWVKAAPFHLGAWAIIVLGLYLLGDNDSQSFHATVGWFFALLGSISIPHIIESHQFIHEHRKPS